MQPTLNFFIFVPVCPYLYLLSFLKVPLLFQAVIYIFHPIWPDLAKCSLKLHSNIQPFYLLFQVPKEYPFNNLYLERGGDPNKDPSEEKHTSNKIISNNVYGC